MDTSCGMPAAFPVQGKRFLKYHVGSDRTYSRPGHGISIPCTVQGVLGALILGEVELQGEALQTRRGEGRGEERRERGAGQGLFPPGGGNHEAGRSQRSGHSSQGSRLGGGAQDHQQQRRGAGPAWEMTFGALVWGPLWWRGTVPST